MNSDIIIKASFLHNQRKTSRVVIDLTQEPDASQNDRKRKQQASLSAVKTQRNKKKHSSVSNPPSIFLLVLPIPLLILIRAHCS